MNEKDFINLTRDVERHEDAVMEDAKEIRDKILLPETPHAFLHFYAKRS